MAAQFPEALINHSPLHAITEAYGTQGLLQRLNHEVSTNFSPDDALQIAHASLVARSLHAEDKRVNEPYNNHVLRVGARLIIHYGVRDPDTVSGGLLHDTVEDHAKELAPVSSPEPKRMALITLADWFNASVSSIVGGVTNPDFDPTRDRIEQYLEHLWTVTKADDPRILVVKLSDFTDNGHGLMYTTGPKVQKAAVKYLPSVPILRAGLRRRDLPLSPAVITRINRQLDATETKLRLITGG